MKAVKIKNLVLIAFSIMFFWGVVYQFTGAVQTWRYFNYIGGLMSIKSTLEYVQLITSIAALPFVIIGIAYIMYRINQSAKGGVI